MIWTRLPCGSSSFRTCRSALSTLTSAPDLRIDRVLLIKLGYGRMKVSGLISRCAMPFLSHRSPVVLLSSVFLVSSLLASMISTPAPKKVEDTYKFGAVVSFNGDLKPWGDDCKRGIELAIEEFNADGGLDGKKIDLSMEDSNSKPE